MPQATIFHPVFSVIAVRMSTGRKYAANGHARFHGFQAIFRHFHKKIAAFSRHFQKPLGFCDNVSCYNNSLIIYGMAV